MEQQKVEELEEVEKEEFKEEAKPELKEYEKLLLAENNRQAYEKALNLVKCGCFEQKTIDTIDFRNYTKIEGRKYKGLYDLYQNLETMELVFICPLVEADKADLDNTKEMAPYAYDCIITEYVDEETYQMIINAANKNLNGPVKAFYIGAHVAYFALLALTLISLIFSLIYCTSATVNPNGDVVYAITVILFYSGALLGASAIATAIMVLVHIKYNKYKE